MSALTNQLFLRVVASQKAQPCFSDFGLHKLRVSRATIAAPGAIPKPYLPNVRSKSRQPDLRLRQRLRCPACWCKSCRQSMPQGRRRKPSHTRNGPNDDAHQGYNSPFSYQFHYGTKLPGWLGDRRGLSIANAARPRKIVAVRLRFVTMWPCRKSSARS